MLRILFIILLFSNITQAQKNCEKQIFQLTENSWISRSVPLLQSPSQYHTLRFVATTDGLTGTLTSKQVTLMDKGDLLILESNNKKKAFAFIGKLRKVSIDNQNHYVNDIALNIEGLDWLSENKVTSFMVTDKTLQKTRHPKTTTNPNGQRDILNIAQCFITAIDPNKVKDIATETPDVQKIDTVVIYRETPNPYKNRTVDAYGDISKQADKSPTRYTGIDRPNYAQTLTELAKLADKANQPEQAEKYYLEAKQNLALFSGIDYGDYPNLLNDLAGFYFNNGNYTKAEKHYLEAKSLIEKIFGIQHKQYPITLNNLGNLNLSIKNYEVAKKYFEASKNVIEQEFDKRYYPEYTTTLNHLANYHRVVGESTQSIDFLFELAKNLIHQLYSYYPSLNEAERIKFLKQVNATVSHFYSSATDFLIKEPKLAAVMADINLSIKGLALEGSIATRTNILTSQDSALQDRYYNWLGVRRQIAQAAIMPKMERDMLGINLEKLNQTALRIEKELSTASESLKNQFQTQRQQITSDSISNQLESHEAVVDFLHFRYHNGERWTDSTNYYAILLQKNSPPQIISLGQMEPLKTILDKRVSYNGQSYINNQELNDRLYQLLWAPIAQKLEKANTAIQKVYISPSGLLHQVAFGGIAVPNKKNSRLIDQYELVMYGTLRDLASKFDRQEKVKDIVLVGGAKFNIDSSKLVEIAKRLKANESLSDNDLFAFSNTAIPLSRAIADNLIRGGLFFKYLSGTKKEVESIERLLSNKQWLTSTYIGEEALEYRIKSHSRQKAPHILHIATHGYFFRPLQPGKNVSKEEFYKQIIYAQNPLMRSGLVLAGSNRVWQGEKPLDNVDDGVLTAYEISNLDLFKTELVVLSACETGLGDIYDSEGVFGLQRAFKSAGVRQMIVSLWKIPDKETAELMEFFYTYYLKHNDAQKALRQAQQQMQKKYPPFYWAGLVLIQ
ncbi:MAG: CHAT domain-containing protein [Aureispira sp.]|nr:CHAT domain-containing protein [Aureispira sp.]